MTRNILVCFLVLSVANISKCDLKLEMFTKIDDTLYPVNTNEIELFSGTKLTLICELISNKNNSRLYDNKIMWTRPLRDVKSTKHINKAEVLFETLLLTDSSNYTCVSAKFKLSKTVELKVREEMHNWNIAHIKTTYCGPNSFQCGPICIRQHYVCDGKKDCPDGSDESLETCKGDPCQDKLKCTGGRCIPTSWCCDIHNDVNCTVSVKPPCCQILSESYEELEQYTSYNPRMYQVNHSGARYLFISVCVVSILFSIVLLLLIVSRVVIFAKKTALQQQRHNLCENIALRNQTNIGLLPCELYTYRNSRTPRQAITRHIIINTSEVNEVNDPLLFDPNRFNVNSGSGDQPPSYVDVLRNNRVMSDPPPPYTSREMLNVDNNARN